MRTLRELAWFAGFFEGEGSMHSRHHSPKTIRAQVQIGSTDRDVLERVVDAVGFGKIYGPYAKDAEHHLGSKPQYRWITGKHEHVQATLAMCWPFLGQRRREQARSVLAMLKEGPLAHSIH